ncbi:MAG: tRNA pseudouridine(13) synthase TruD [Candidatus Odinarchaeota archaeon]
MLKISPLSFIGIDYSPTWSRERGFIKQKPEDFIVREVTPDGMVIDEQLRLKGETGLFTHFLLKKSGIDTLSARGALKSFLEDGTLSIKESDISFAGLKDAKAITYQRGSIWNVKPEKLQNFTHDQMAILSAVTGLYEVAPGDLTGNHFQIVVRSPDINADLLKTVSEKVKAEGVPNFFMLQRFGSRRPILHKIGKCLLKRDYKSAVLGYICVASSLEQEDILNARISLIEKGLDGLPSFLKKMPKKYYYERKLAHLLDSKHPNFQRAIYSLPRDFLKLAISAYQSYIFNITVSALIKENSFDLINRKIPMPGQDYTTYRGLDAEIEEQVNGVLEDENLELEQYNKNNRVKGFKTKFRKAIIFPEKLQIECNKSFFNLKFSLCKGSYATAIINQFSLVGDLDIELMFPDYIDWV